MPETARCDMFIDMIVSENPEIAAILQDQTLSEEQMIDRLRSSILLLLYEHPKAFAYYSGEITGEKAYFKLSWRDFAFIRVLDYLGHEGESFEDPNLHGKKVISRPFGILRDAVQARVFSANEDFYEDLLHLLRQLKGIERPQIPSRQQVYDWMGKHPSGLDQEIIELRKARKDFIIDELIQEIREAPRAEAYSLPKDSSREADQILVRSWWEEDTFQLMHAVRTTERLQKLLDGSLEDETIAVMDAAIQKGIPIFVTPYFLSMLMVDPPEKFRFADIAIREYVLYSKSLVEEFGRIDAWEKEDKVVPGRPNAAGWILPSNNIHRRYPNVAIFIPSTMGRACGGLCAYCQRMYDFQKGRFNFDLEQLKPKESWHEQLRRLMKYFEEDAQLQDILITGGDAMMSSTASLKEVLDAVYDMAKRKSRANEERPDGQKYAEIVRVRLGTKIPIYLPFRITEQRVRMLQEFRRKAEKIGIRQFIIQTHFSSAMEVSPEAAEAVRKLLAAGWCVNNQEVFTAAASRRGHTAKLRQVLNTIGVLPYYTFTVKGYLENEHCFANNSRSIQEQIEEKSIGRVDPKYYSLIRSFMKEPQDMQQHIDRIRSAEEIPFLATDRNTINLPGVGKSNIYRTIGITPDGRRILSFEQDHSRPHSPIIKTMGKVIIIESKSVSAYLRQLERIGEDIEDYQSIWGYSAGYIETRMPVFEYPGYPFLTTKKFTNLLLPDSDPTDVQFVEHDDNIYEGSTD